MEYRVRKSELRQIRNWYDRIEQETSISQDDIVRHFRGYADQAEILIRRVRNGQTWEDFVMGIQGVPPTLVSRLLRQFRSH